MSCEQNFYYKVALPGLDVELVYESSLDLEPFTFVLVSVRSKQNLAFIISKTEKPNFDTIEIEKVLDIKFTDIQIELLKFIKYYYCASYGLILELFEPIKKGLNFRQSYEKFTIFNSLEFQKIPNLSTIQKDALKFIKSNMTSLVFGDTGSGKSEIYISLIAEILNKQEQVLFLMPEISLTPQMQTRLESYFGESVAIWHSKVSKRQKELILKNILNGKVKLIAGARSALFLPLNRLKLIIVDEEHDESYKSTSRPHYNARDLSLFLSHKLGIKTVLGSATPSLTTFCKIPSFRIKGTFFKSDKKYIFDKSQTGLSSLILNEIRESLKNKKQVIICLPTRANFRFLSCRDCGTVIKCPFCSIGMSFYKKERVLKCQYCEYKMPIQTSCPNCDSTMIEAVKLGTSELMEILESKFANARVSKFDRDEITTQNKLKKTLKEFNDKEIDILVGTQMLSKGHDYHNVDLAVVMGVDELLNYPDFRARERTLALVKQVAGRAGRSGQGRVVLQSFESEFFSQYLEDYDKFLKDEKDYREGLYPPFSRLLRVVISHKNDKFANEILKSNLEKIKNLQSKFEFDIIGYGKCGIEMIASKFRYQILLRAKSHKPLLEVSRLCSGEFSDCDIDPINFS